MANARKKPVPVTQRWRVALANAGLKQAAWARDHGWTESHVSQVVAGKRESSVVMKAVLAFVADQERRIGARAAQESAA